jgi:hypothetical protein
MFGSKGRKKGGGSVFVSQEREEREERKIRGVFII